MKQLCAVLLFLLLISGVAHAQQTTNTTATIVGRVIDATSKDAVIGARITFDPEFLSIPRRAELKSKGAISRADGTFELAAPDTGSFVLEIRQPGYDNAYVEFPARFIHADTLVAPLDREQHDEVVVEAKASAKTVEDLCCRVEELNAELTRVAAFTPDMQQVMSRYSSCTSYHINCTLDHSQTVRLRGMDNPYTLMLLDGVPLFSAITTQYGMQMIPALATDNARIIEGSSTTVYGNNAIAGVLSFDLKQPTEEREAFVQTNLASSASHGLEGAYDINASYRNSDERRGVAVVASFNQHPIELGDFFSEAPGLTRFSGYLTGHDNISSSTKIRLTALGGRDLRKVRGGGERNSEVMTETLNLIGRVETALSDVSQLNLTAGWAYAEHRVNDLNAGQHVGFDTSTYFTRANFGLDSRVLYGQALFTTGMGDHFITSGLEARSEMVDANATPWFGPTTGALFDVTPPLHDFSTISAFAEDQVSLGDAWTLLVGARADQHSSAGFAVSPRASVAFRSSPELRHRIMVGQGVKGQALFNEDHRIMHGTYSYQYNDDFEYERSTAVSYDFNWTYTLGDEIGGILNFNAFYWNIDGKSMPQADSLAGGKIFFVNSEDPARLMGIEVQTRPSFSEHWSGSLAFSVINLTQVNAQGARERVPLSPTINADASVMYHLDEAGFATELWGSIIGKQRLPENPFGVATSPVLGLLNLRAQKKLGIFTLHAGVQNLLDTEQSDTMPLAYEQNRTYVTNIGFAPMEGREFFA
ncbi:MAG TPA: TonB-dependent receptor, partial [Candidatus Kapabacteria bacterium]|nr:TonB-dependent receptor [Candidatus Kapabacteria bacterium]